MTIATNFVNVVMQQALRGESDFHLVDVGASGGIAAHWAAFGDQLAAVGFDPLVADMHRLQAAETRPKVRYEAAFVSSTDIEHATAAGQLRGYATSSAHAALHIRQQNYARDMFNAGAPLEYAQRSLSLDEYFEQLPGPDFIKIDTDGAEYAVLRGADRLLQSGVLGLEVEMQFQGALHDRANIFSNIDRYLRTHGFSLFGLSPHRYSRAALPRPFLYELAAQTTGGQVMWADAVYFRDLADQFHDQIFGYTTTREAVLKLCCLFVLFDLSDCAAEILTSHPILAELPERDALLDILTPLTFGRLSYADYIARFKTDPRVLFPSRLGRLWDINSGQPRSFSVSAVAAPVRKATGLPSLRAPDEWQGTLEGDRAGVRLTTTDVAWGYCAEIEVDRRRLKSSGPFCLRVELKVERGRIGIAALNADGSDFIAEQVVGDHPAFVVADLEIPSFDLVKQLIVRNASRDGTSAEAVFRSITLYEPALPEPG